MKFVTLCSIYSRLICIAKFIVINLKNLTKKESRHCEEQSDVATQIMYPSLRKNFIIWIPTASPREDAVLDTS